MVGGDLVQELGANGGVLHVRRGDQHGKEKADRVGDDAPLLICLTSSGSDATACCQFSATFHRGGHPDRSPEPPKSALRSHLRSQPLNTAPASASMWK